MTEEELSAIEARANAATSQPWIPDLGRAEVSNGVGSLTAECNEWHDAEFIAACRQDVPKLLAEVRRLNLRVYEHDGVIECMRADEAEAEVTRLQHICEDALWLAADGDVQEAKSRLRTAFVPALQGVQPPPRYSTEAVDALIDYCFEHFEPRIDPGTGDLMKLVEGVRASREPPR